MLSQGKELAAIDFAHIIGGPLTAVITAQAQAAHVTTDYIQQIAFEPQSGADSTKLKTVEFDYSQILGSQSGAGGLQDAMTIKVPLITMIPIPFIRVDSMTIDFNVNLHDIKTTKLDNNFTFNASAKENEGADFIVNESTTFSASVTDQNTYQNNMTVDDTYSLRVSVHAVQDQMPGGMSQILNIFSNVIQQQSALIQTIMTTEIQAQTQQIQQQLGTGAGGGSAPPPPSQS